MKYFSFGYSHSCQWYSEAPGRRWDAMLLSGDKSYDLTPSSAVWHAMKAEAQNADVISNTQWLDGII